MSGSRATRQTPPIQDARTGFSGKKFQKFGSSLPELRIPDDAAGRWKGATASRYSKWWNRTDQHTDRPGTDRRRMCENHRPVQPWERQVPMIRVVAFVAWLVLGLSEGHAQT